MRRRHYHDSLIRPDQAPQRRWLRLVSAVIIVSGVVFVSYTFLQRVLPFGGAVRAAGALVALEGGEAQTVNVAIDGSDPVRAQDGLRLYADDALSTGPGSHAGLRFFDGTIIRLDENTSVTLQESRQSDAVSRISVSIENGGVWVRTPAASAFSGSVARLLSTQAMDITLPTGADALVSQTLLAVFEGEGAGASIKLETGDTVIVGEGQALNVQAALVGEPYGARRPVAADDANDFVSHSRTSLLASTVGVPPAAMGGPIGSDVELTISQPLPQSVVTGNVATVAGTVGSDVTRLQINGYEAPIDNGTYALELALPAEEEITIIVIAFGEDGARLAEERRTIVRDRTPPPSPRFTTPAKDGETYRTAETRFEIIGEAPANAAGIIINDYRLQFFRPGDRTWRYLASTELDNIKEGENIFTAKAIYEGGDESDPVTMTIMLGAGETGTVETGSGSTSEPPETTEPDSQVGLPTNDPTQPGAISITAPSTSGEITSGEVELLIEGNVPATVNSVWVNDYRLRLFDPGETIWNYIASVELGTLKPGRNSYEITARSSDNQIIDRQTYVITYEPAGN